MHDLTGHPHPLTVDPITLEVIHRGLVSITNQIDANIKRTAFSPYIYEYNDFAVGLVGAGGQLIAQCTAACRRSSPIRSAWRCATA
jgi:N-methylhydantoinase B/oxoprolinase/acetone carboxylase alpha subunit